MDDSSFCPVCHHSDGNVLIEHRSAVPTLQNTTLPTKEAALDFPTGSLRMVRCSACGFVWNADFDPGLIFYDAGYNNDVSTSSFYAKHLEAMAERVIQSVPRNHPIRYVEIGCGEADFLNLVVQKSGGRCVSAVGFDPSFTGESRLLPGVTIHKTFFGKEQLSLVPEGTNVICSRHTIEHVPDVQGFVGALALATKSAERRLFLETPDADWILRHVAFQDFFYEHCSLFTPDAMVRLLANHALTGEVASVYGGQYMWVEARRSAANQIESLSSRGDSLALAGHYIEKQTALIEHWASSVKDRRTRGPVAIWGGASKGVTFALLLTRELGCELDCAIDLNSAKQGRYLPTTGLPVVAPEEARGLGVQTVLIMNPNYEDEIRALAEQMGWYPEFVTLNSVAAGHSG